MIAALGDWLKQIIVMVLIATFVELILPGKSMERYVKVVVSLFLLLAILTPIIQLLRSDFDLDFNLDMNPSAQQAGAQAASVLGVMQQGEELRKTQEQQAFALLEHRTGQLMAKELEGHFPVQVAKIEVEAGLDSLGEAELRRINLVIAIYNQLDSRWEEKEQQLETADSIVSIKPIEPIEPIYIDIQLDDQSARGSALSQSHAAHAEQLMDDIKAWLSSRWTVAVSSIQIAMAE